MSEPTHDVPDPWEQNLQHHQRFLLRLAARLAGPEADAEDLVQDAFVRALEHPPRARSEDGSMRAWLATVLRRAAGRNARAKRRRDERELFTARPEAAEDHAAVDARLDAHAELLSMLRDLPENERLALFLRYSEDLNADAIARRLKVPVETVRTRLRRGRERLRKSLDHRHGDRATWATLLVPPGIGTIAAPLQPGIETAAPVANGAGQAATAAKWAQWVGAGVLMGTGAKIAGGALVCAAALFVWMERGDGVDRGAAAAPETPIDDSVELVGAEVVAAEEAPTTREVAPAAEEPAVTELVIDGFLAAAPSPDPIDSVPWPILVRAVGAPADGAHVRVSARLDAFGRYSAEPVEGVIQSGNESRLDVGHHLADLMAHAAGARAEELVVKLEHPDLVPTEASLVLPDPLDPMQPPDEPWVIEVTVERAAIVVGRLIGEDGKPPQGEKVVQAHALDGTTVARTHSGDADIAEDGTFRLRVDGVGSHALLAVAESSRPATARVVLVRGSAVDVGDILIRPGVAIDGRAVDLSGAPQEGANVFAMIRDADGSVDLGRWSFELPGTLAWTGDSFELLVGQAKTEADGRFRILGLAPRLYQVDTSPADVEAPFPLEEKQEVTAPATIEVRPYAAELRLTFRFPDGEARAGTGVLKLGASERSLDMAKWRFDTTRVFRYALPPESAFDLTFDFNGMQPVHLPFDTPGVGGVIERDVTLVRDLAAASVTLILTGAPVDDGQRFTVVVRDGEHSRDFKAQVADSRIEMSDLGPGPVEIELTAGSDRFAPEAHLRNIHLSLDLLPGEDRVVEVALERGGTMILEALDDQGERIDASCRVYDASGQELDVIFVARIPNGRVAGHNHLFPGGPARAVPEFAAGLYRVTVRAGGFHTEELDILVEAGATAERSITLRRK